MGNCHFSIIKKVVAPMMWWKLRVKKIWGLPVFVIHRLFSFPDVMSPEVFMSSGIMARHWQKKLSRFSELFDESPDRTGATEYFFVFMSAKVIIFFDNPLNLSKKLFFSQRLHHPLHIFEHSIHVLWCLANRKEEVVEVYVVRCVDWWIV